jgi:hypothetical protein
MNKSRHYSTLRLHDELAHHVSRFKHLMRAVPPHVLRILYRAIHVHLIEQTGVKPGEATSGAVTLIQRFGSAANLNTHLHALVLDGIYRTGDDKGSPEFTPAQAPNNEQLQTLLNKIIGRILKLLTRLGHLTEEDGITSLARSDNHDPDNVMASLQAAASTWRIAAGPRAGRKVLTLVVGGERSATRISRVRHCAPTTRASA